MISINKYSINSKISERYAITVYSFNFFNNEQSGSSELKFAITIDPHSFISGFKANIDGEIFEGETKEKVEAKTEYIAAKEKNENAILISQPDTNIPNVFEISTNIDAKSNISLDITIEQYLTKKFNFNQLTVQILNDFDNITKHYENICYQLIIKDKRGIYDIKMPEYLSNDNVINMKDDKKCIIDGTIQQSASAMNVNELILKYKIKGEQNESTVLFDNSSRVFCHIISDLIANSQINMDHVEEGGNDEIKENILIPRRVVFVIDKSGSMSGSRWNQAISSTVTAIKQLRLNYDRYSIIFFSDRIEKLSNDLYVANNKNISETISYLTKQSAGGRTDINSALIQSINMIKNDIKLLNQSNNNVKNHFNFYMNQIIVITDGEPNVGESDTNKIILNVKNANSLSNIDKYSSKISIFACGVGSSKNDKTWIHDLNHSFLKLLSLHNNGIYSRIKQTNIDTQLNEFYGILSKPILTNVQIGYNNKFIHNLTNTTFHTLFSGNDLIICGKLTDNNIDTISATITAITGKEIRKDNQLIATKPIFIHKKIKLYFNNTVNKNVEKIWAYLTLQQFAKQKLINEDNKTTLDDTNPPLSLAMKYQFVTPWTSMIVVKQKERAENAEQHQQLHHYPTPTKTENISAKIQSLANKINSRKTNFRRRAPPFSRTLRPSSFTYPATSAARRSRRLQDIEEDISKDTEHLGFEHRDSLVIDEFDDEWNNDYKNNNDEHEEKQSIIEDEKNNYDLRWMNAGQVCQFIASMGSAYPAYKFKNIIGAELMKFNENNLIEIGIEHKLHRDIILSEIVRRVNGNNCIFESGTKVLNWDRFEVKEWMEKHSYKMIREYATKFFNHGINGFILLDLDRMDLSVIGVQKAHQSEVLKIIAEFREEIFKSMNKYDEVLDTMAELLTEIGGLFTSDKVQSITSLLQRQLNQLRQNRRQ